MAEQKVPVVETLAVKTVSINGKDIPNDHISNIKIKNISDLDIDFESGTIKVGDIGLATAAEAEALSEFIERV